MSGGSDSPPVRMWRDKFKLNLSKSWKIDVDKTVTDLVLWRKILNDWKYRDSRGKWKSRAPGIKQLLDEYDRRALDTKNEIPKSTARTAEHSSEGSAARLSKRSASVVPIVLERKNGWAG